MLAADAVPFGVLFLLLLLRVPIGFALLAGGLVAGAVSGDASALSTVRILVGAPRHYTLLAIPLFVLTAEIFVACGLVAVLYDAGRAFFGHLPGGIANATVAGTIVFAGASGSSAADAAAFSRIGVQGMTADGHSSGFAAALVAASSTLAIMIPPSIAMIIYGALTDTSIGALMFGGVVPGLLFGGLLMLFVAAASRRRRKDRPPRSSFRERRSQLLRVAPILGLLVVILGGFYTGSFTATEVSAVSALFALFVGRFFYRTLRLRDLPEILQRTVSTTSAIFFIIIGGTVFAKALTASGFAARLASGLGGAELEGWQFLLGVTVLLYFLGMFLEGISLNVMTTPLLAPIAFELGVDPVQYGIFLIFNIEVALISPPVGLHLFIASAASGVAIEEIYREIWPFIGLLLLGVLSLVFVPEYALWLPELVYGE